MRILGYDVVIMEKDCLEKYDLTSACSSESACCKNDSFPAISLFAPSSQTHSPQKKKRERKRGRKDVNAPQMGEGKRQSYAISFVFAGNEDPNQIVLDYGIKCIEMQVLPLSSLVSASPQSCEYRGVQQRDRRE